MQPNKKIIKSIINTILFCGTHDLPLRGKANDEGVLYDLLMMRISVGAEALKNNLEDGKQNAKYTSPQIQNEIVDISAKVIKNYICTDVKKASAYSILADETADMAGKEQLR
ncbi:uncharacterized protein LOC120781080 [Bactrocera tryoni]|uniref:uncharacterized protein LOC120781080 n=1 Tax=Bactrocera tryoni TaxID=59916 RepID=UPI001A97504B|nr:uncharacterized protein LOC120781080 [Bactrocera tryoni]